MSAADDATAGVPAIGPAEDPKPLTAVRASVAVPVGGRYRRIDFAPANCLRSGLRRTRAPTRPMSHSLHRRLRAGYGATVDNATLFSGVRGCEGARLRNCIVEKRARIPPNPRIGFDRETGCRRILVTDRGTAVVSKGYAFEAAQAHAKLRASS